MPDTRFFQKGAALSLREICWGTGAVLPPGYENAAAEMICDVAPLDTAFPGSVAFLNAAAYMNAVRVTRATAVFVKPGDAAILPDGCVPLTTKDPYRAFGVAAQMLYPEAMPAPGLHAAAHIDPSAMIGEGCCIEAGACIGEGAELGPACHIGCNAVIGRGVVLGAGCRIGAGASLEFCRIGDAVRIHSGARLGVRGFGFAMDKDDGHHDIPQLGLVVVGDRVEIGANCTIDRGMMTNTEIGAGTRMDNLVHIAHNVKIGRNCVIVAMVGIAGGAVLEDGVICAAQSGITGHVRIGAGATIAARSGVTKNVSSQQTVAGFPAAPIKDWRRRQAAISKLARIKTDQGQEKT